MFQTLFWQVKSIYKTIRKDKNRRVDSAYLSLTISLEKYIRRENSETIGGN